MIMTAMSVVLGVFTKVSLAFVVTNQMIAPETGSDTGVSHEEEELEKKVREQQEELDRYKERVEQLHRDKEEAQTRLKAET